ncbi:MAG TPA: DUF1236 domain-containing protein [Xanthobacteraceae bacterium]|nr:DUF1236 domain-containing protein [Xanthobacteraceae bacterium]
MKRALWMGVAAVALLAGINSAPAQVGGDQQQPRMQNQPSGNRGEEKINPGMHQKEPGATVQKDQSGAIVQKDQKDKGKTSESQNQPQNQPKNIQSQQGQTEHQGQMDQRGNQGKMSRDQDRDKDKMGQNEHTTTKSVQLSAQQREKIHTTILGQKAGHTTDVKFEVSVGARVPRTVRFYPLPLEIVEIVPEYRGYDYVLVGDEIVIIDPNTLEIVAVLPA